MSEHRESLSYINTAKGIGIILVVLGHTIVPEIRGNSVAAKMLYGLIYSFHMPLFFMLSGVLFAYHKKRYQEQGFGSFMKNKLKSLMLPYLSFSLVSYIGLGIAFLIPFAAQILIRAGYENFTIFQAAFSILTYENHIDKHLWFCYSLFIAFGISYLLYFRYERWYITFTAFIVAYAIKLPHIAGISIWIILYRAMTMLVFFNIGRFVPAFVSLIRRKKRPIFALFVAFALFYSLTNVCSFFPGAILFDILTSVAGAFLFTAVAICLDSSRVRAPLQILGKYSYDIYLMHQPFIVSGASGVLLAATSLPYWIICAFTFVLGIVLPMFASKFIIRKNSILKLIFLGS